MVLDDQKLCLAQSSTVIAVSALSAVQKSSVWLMSSHASAGYWLLCWLVVLLLALLSSNTAVHGSRAVPGCYKLLLFFRAVSYLAGTPHYSIACFDHSYRVLELTVGIHLNSYFDICASYYM